MGYVVTSPTPARAFDAGYDIGFEVGKTRGDLAAHTALVPAPEGYTWECREQFRQGQVQGFRAAVGGFGEPVKLKQGELFA